MWSDWEEIRNDMVTHGLRNSLLVALMPTGSSATIAGVTECFEIQTSNLYSRKVLSGQFTVINKYLVKELDDMGLWCESLAHEIMEHEGSVADIKTIPGDIKRRYRTVWEHSMKTVIDMAADRAPFICQTQSMNLYLRRPTVPKMNSMLSYAHSKGLKTLMYYLHTKSTASAIKFTVDKDGSVDGTNSECTEEEDTCLSCSA
jgi:ribonucleotide reductase alpha subunit